MAGVIYRRRRIFRWTFLSNYVGLLQIKHYMIYTIYGSHDMLVAEHGGQRARLVLRTWGLYIKGYLDPLLPVSTSSC